MHFDLHFVIEYFEYFDCRLQTSHVSLTVPGEKLQTDSDELIAFDYALFKFQIHDNLMRNV